MVQNLKDLLERALGRKSTAVARMDGNAMVIDCLGCGFTPEPASKECLRCMVNNMSELGGAERIILRTGKDIEISGKTTNVIRNISSLRRWSLPPENDAFRCKRCNVSRAVVMNDLWDEFPELPFADMMSRLDQEGQNEECSDCIRSSIIALEQLQSDIDRIVGNMSG